MELLFKINHICVTVLCFWPSCLLVHRGQTALHAALSEQLMNVNKHLLSNSFLNCVPVVYSFYKQRFLFPLCTSEKKKSGTGEARTHNIFCIGSFCMGCGALQPCIHRASVLLIVKLELSLNVSIFNIRIFISLVIWFEMGQIKIIHHKHRSH